MVVRNPSSSCSSWNSGQEKTEEEDEALPTFLLKAEQEAPTLKPQQREGDAAHAAAGRRCCTHNSRSWKSDR